VSCKILIISVVPRTVGTAANSFKLKDFPPDKLVMPLLLLLDITTFKKETSFSKIIEIIVSFSHLKLKVFQDNQID
jgi:hypothetical protein